MQSNVNKKTVNMSMSNKIAKVLVIGGGITSAVSTSILSERLGKNVQITVWDKARGAGGRMSTSRSPGNPDCIADLGAQYVSAKPEYFKRHEGIYQDLLSNKLIRKFDGVVANEHNSEGVIHYVATEGTASIVKHFFNKSGVNVNFGHHINHISITTDDKIQVSTQDGKNETFDSALMTMPVPQILQLQGMNKILDNSLSENLSKVQYCARYGLALFFDKHEDCISVGQQGTEYLQDKVFYYVSQDPQKRLGSTTDPTSIVFLTNSKFGSEYLETPIPEVEKMLVAQYKKLYADWPHPNSVKCQRWRYSQVSTPFPGCPHAVTLNKAPLLLAGGDAFVEEFATVDGCIASAIKMSELLIAKM